jgi:hypothetical protein
MQFLQRANLRLFLLTLLSCSIMNAANLTRYNFTDFGVSMEVPEGWHIAYYNDNELYVTENPLVDNHWDEKGFIFGAVLVSGNETDCPLAPYGAAQNSYGQFMTPVLDDGNVTLPAPDHYLMTEDEVPWKQGGTGQHKEIHSNYVLRTSYSRSNYACIMYYTRFFDNYYVMDYSTYPYVEEPDPRIPPYPNQDLYHDVKESIKKINVTRREPDFYILTSLGVLCPENPANATCAINDSLVNLKSALSSEGYRVQVVSLEKGDSTGLDAVLAGDARSSFHDVAKNLTQNTTVFIVGSYSVVPPCLYNDPVETENVPGFLDNQTPRMLISDDCYGTYGDGPSEAIVSRLPTGSVADATDYINAMAAYHYARASGTSGLNRQRLEEMYGKECPAAGMDFYYLSYVRPFGGFFNYSEGVHRHEYGKPSGSGPQEYSAFPLQYFAFHGSPENDRWFADDVPVIRAESQPYPFSSMSASCFGGFLSGSSIPETWLLSQTTADSNKPSAFVGSTDISYFSDILDFPIGADIIVNDYHGGLESGKTMGQALRDAKQHIYAYDYSDRPLGGLINWLKTSFGENLAIRQNRKNAITYQLYGDPLLTKADMINSNSSGCDWIG